MHVAVAGALAALILTLFPSMTQAQQIKLTPRIGLGTLAQTDADPAFETRTLGQLAGLDSAAFTGDVLLLRKDRGPHVGRYAVLVTVPSGSRQDMPAVAPTFPTVQSYELVGADRLGPLPTVDVLGVHYIKVRPERAAAFEQFVARTLNPAVGNLRPDLRFLYYKGSNPEAGYVTVVAITKASRDKYWPNGSDSDDLKAAFTPAVRSLATELQTYLVDGTWGTGMTAQVYEAKEWADWVVVPAAR